ncbi:MAG: hypothetical protein RDU30_10020 [Desulfovibrionaceae bacterium]|nr:hypothetical protein [Desulfovibrionaceae bacterium]
MSEQWRLVPGFPAYEVNRLGVVRKRVTGYRPRRNGRRYQLWHDGIPGMFHPYELVALAFPGDDAESSDPVETSAPVETPEPVAALADETESLKRENLHLRRLVAELEAERSVYAVDL